MYRLMQPSDKAAVLALWQRERGESEEFAANAVVKNNSCQKASVNVRIISV